MAKWRVTRDITPYNKQINKMKEKKTHTDRVESMKAEDTRMKGCRFNKG